MTLRFEQILADGVAECSYLLGDDAEHTCAVVDPRPDVEIYLETARRFGMAITHVFETHIHADFLSGARELVDRLGGQAKLYVSTEGGAGRPRCSTGCCVTLRWRTHQIKEKWEEEVREV